MTKVEFSRLVDQAPFRWCKEDWQKGTAPHAYTYRRNWNDKDFCEAVLFIRTSGYPIKFWSKEYIYYDLNGFHYWTMGEALNKDGKPHTILMNRAYCKTVKPTEYHDASGYDELFNTDGYHAEDKELFKLLGQVKGSVLDVGCGTGMFLNHYTPKDYTGIDNSLPMLAVFRRANKTYADRGLYTTLGDFKPWRRYDNVFGIYSASYINDPKDFLRVWNGKGKLFLTYFKPTYNPITHIELGISPPYNHYTKQELESIFDTKVIDFGDYYIIKK